MPATLQDSNFGRLLFETQVQCASLNLEGIGTNWLVLKLPWSKQPTTATGVISPAPEQLAVREGTNGQADMRYRLLLTMYQPGNRDLQTGMGLELLWRQTVRQHFHLTRNLDAAAQAGLAIISTTVEPGNPLLPLQFKKMVDAQFLILNVRVREPFGG